MKTKIGQSVSQSTVSLRIQLAFSNVGLAVLVFFREPKQEAGKTKVAVVTVFLDVSLASQRRRAKTFLVGTEQVLSKQKELNLCGEESRS